MKMIHSGHFIIIVYFDSGRIRTNRNRYGSNSIWKKNNNTYIYNKY